MNECLIIVNQCESITHSLIVRLKLAMAWLLTGCSYDNI